MYNKPTFLPVPVSVRSKA